MQRETQWQAQTARIAIVGAGLSGLDAAYLLERQGVRDYVVSRRAKRLAGVLQRFLRR